MHALHTLIIVLTVIVSILLIGIVLIQKSKGGGLSSQFGNVSAGMGVRETNTFLEKGTWYLIALVFILSIASAYTTKGNSGRQMRSSGVEGTAPAAGANQFGADAHALPIEAPEQGK